MKGSGRNMDHAITFIIPVRHQDNAPNWAHLKSKLAQTIQSISSQDCPAWRAIIVANEGADLPNLPDRFKVKRVDFPPNELYRQGNAAQEDFREAIRMDKGRRILAGLLHASPTGHVMVVDDDDFISCRIASYVAANSEENGWFIQKGYIWTDETKFLYKHNSFMHICGTSLIVRADLYDLPADFESASPTYIKRILGSHIFLVDELKNSGHPLAPLPFAGAIYRTGHAGSHSRSKGIFQEYLLNRSILFHPRQFLYQIRQFKLKSGKIETEFFGTSG